MKDMLIGAALLRRLIPAGLCAALVSTPLFGQAAAPAKPADEIVTLSEFTVSGESVDRYRAADAISAVRVRAPLLDTASSISVLTREMIDDLVPSRIFDVTRFVAGVQEGRGMQFQDRMILRGFETQAGPRTVDNFLQPADADNIEEAIIERIEIAKGPNAILAPSGAPGGSINIITKSPSFKPRRTLTALAGLYDAQKVTLDMTGPLGASKNLAYRFVGSLQDSRRYWDEDARLRGKSFAPMITWRISDKTTFTAKLVAAEHWIFREPLLIVDSAVNAGTDDPYFAPGIKAKSLNGIQPWSHVGTHSADLFTQLTTSVNENIALRFAANGRYYFEDSDQEFLSTPSLTNRYNPTTGVLTQDQTWAIVGGVDVATNSPFYNPAAIPVRGDIQATRRKTANLQADLVGNYKFARVTSQTVTGLAYSRQLARGHTRTGVLPAVNLNTPNVEIYPTYPATLASHNASTFKNYQFYLNQRLGFMKDRVFITGGVMRFDTKTTGRNLLTGAAAAVLDDAKTMKSVSALVKPLENVAFYYSFSTNSSPTIANNVPLWRDGRQHEGGFKSEWFGQRLSFNGAYFKIEQTNVTIPNPDRQTNPTAPEQLVSDFGNHGVEFELMGRVTPNLSAIGTLSFLKMRDSLGRKVRAVADQNASLLLNYRFPAGELKGLSLNFGTTYSGKRAGDTPINFTPRGTVGQVSFYLKPMFTTTAGASYRWQEKYYFRLNVDNVLNERDHINIAGGRVSGTGITAAPGTNIKFSTTVEF
jgi:iron complex outermembrane receptor protein